VSATDRRSTVGTIVKVPNLRLRVAAIAAIAALAVVAARVAAPSHASHFRYSAALACGFDRWSVKTLKDRPRLLRARPTTLDYLVSRPAPRPLPSKRLPFEYRVFTVTAAVTLVRPESDSDFHLDLQNGGSHMIAEAPAPECTVGATPYRRRQIRNARAAVRLCSRAKIWGVAFFDFQVGQTGVAPNAIELHPILDFICTDARTD
jgi:hypothetical protein